MHTAIWIGCLQIAASLLQSGADPNITDNKGVFIYIFHRVPLFLAVRRMDIQSVRLLLDYGADPNALYNNMSLLSYAAKNSDFQIMKMLLDAGADVHLGDPQPLETVINYGSRVCLAALLNGNDDLLTPIKGKLPIQIALEAQTPLLSVIAVYTKRQIDEKKQQKESGQAVDESVLEFPPSTLKRSQIKKLNAALKQNDYLLPTDVVNRSVLHIKSPWKKKNEVQDVADISASLDISINNSLMLSKSRKAAALSDDSDNGIDYGVPPSPFTFNSRKEKKPKRTSTTETNAKKDNELAQNTVGDLTTATGFQFEALIPVNDQENHV